MGFGTILKAIFGAIFGSLWNRLFPARTASDQKAADLAETLAARSRMDQAAAQAPVTDDEVHDILSNGKL